MKDFVTRIVGRRATLLGTSPLALLTLSACGGGGASSSGDGDKLVPSFLLTVSTSDEGASDRPSVAALPSGGFVSVWHEGGGKDGDGQGIFGRIIDENFARNGEEFQVNTITTSHQSKPSVASLSDGTFMVVWSGGDGSSQGQIYTESGSQIGDQFEIGPWYNQEAFVIGTSNNEFMVVRGQNNQDSGILSVYNSTGVLLIGDVVLTTSGKNLEIRLAEVDSNTFISSWFDSNNPAGSDIYGIIIDRFGDAQGPEVQFNSTTANNQQAPEVVGLSSGKFAVVWQSNTNGVDSYDVIVRLFGADGEPITDEIIINEMVLGVQPKPSIAISSSGEIIVAWETGEFGASELLYQVLDFDGHLLGDNKKLSVDDDGDWVGGSDITLTTSSSGNILASWDDGTGNIFAKNINDDASPVVGYDTIEGRVVKGPLSNALVGLDYDGDGVVDGRLIRTDADGNFSVRSTHENYTVIAVTDDATIDKSSGAVLSGITLKAPQGATVVTPTTTLMEEGDLTAAQVASVLGLPDGVDPLTFNPFADGVSASDALAVEKVSQKVMSVVNAFASAAEGAGATEAAAYTAALNSIVEVVKTKATASGSLDLTDTADLALIKTKAISEIATSAGVNTTAFNALADDTATAVKNVNTKIETVSDLTSDASKSIFSTTQVLADQVKTAAEAELSSAGSGSNSITFTDSDAVNTAASNAAPTDISLSASTISEAASSLVIGRLSTTDSDQTAGVKPTYILAEIVGSDYALFAIDQATGDLSLKKQPNFETKETYSVTILSMDEGGKTFSKTFSISVGDVNETPTVANAIADQTIAEDSALSFQLAPNVFADVDTGDSFTYTATLADGSALPTWLAFNAATRTFSGTPLNGDVGAIAVKVTATDSGSAAVSDTFDLTVTNTNDAPTVVNPIEDGTATEGVSYVWQFDANVFEDVDVGDSLTYTATLEDGSDLPDWLTFDADNLTASGTPPNSAVGVIVGKLTATDTSGASVSDIVALTVVNTNSTPTVANAIADQTIAEDSALSFQLAPNVFADVDTGDSFTYTATLADGSALPTWLAFNAATRTFSGTPLNGDVGAIAVKVTATDSGSAAVSDTFDLTVTNTSDAAISFEVDLDATKGLGEIIDQDLTAFGSKLSNFYNDPDSGINNILDSLNSEEFGATDDQYAVSSSGISVSNAAGYTLSLEFSNFSPTSLAELEDLAYNFDGEIENFEISGGFEAIALSGPDGKKMIELSHSAEGIAWRNLKAGDGEIDTFMIEGDFKNQIEDYKSVLAELSKLDVGVAAPSTPDLLGAVTSLAVITGISARDDSGEIFSFRLRSNDSNDESAEISLKGAANTHIFSVGATGITAFLSGLLELDDDGSVFENFITSDGPYAAYSIAYENGDYFYQSNSQSDSYQYYVIDGNQTNVSNSAVGVAEPDWLDLSELPDIGVNDVVTYYSGISNSLTHDVVTKEEYDARIEEMQVVVDYIRDNEDVQELFGLNFSYEYGGVDVFSTNINSIDWVKFNQTDNIENNLDLSQGLQFIDFDDGSDREITLIIDENDIVDLKLLGVNKDDFEETYIASNNDLVVAIGEYTDFIDLFSDDYIEQDIA